MRGNGTTKEAFQRGFKALALLLVLAVASVFGGTKRSYNLSHYAIAVWLLQGMVQHPAFFLRQAFSRLGSFLVGISSLPDIDRTPAVLRGTGCRQLDVWHGRQPGHVPPAESYN